LRNHGSGVRVFMLRREGPKGEGKRGKEVEQKEENNEKEKGKD